MQHIANVAGCSRQYVHQVVGGTRRKPGPSATSRLREFVKTHPKALTTKARGGMSLREIAAKLGVRPDVVGRAWRSLNLPDRREYTLSPSERAHRSYERNKERRRIAMYAWRAQNPDKERAIRLRAVQRLRSKVLRRERCVVCRRAFAWTQGQEARRKGRGQRIVCSVRCGILAGIRSRSTNPTRIPSVRVAGQRSDTRTARK